MNHTVKLSIDLGLLDLDNAEERVREAVSRARSYGAPPDAFTRIEIAPEYMPHSAEAPSVMRVAWNPDEPADAS